MSDYRINMTKTLLEIYRESGYLSSQKLYKRAKEEGLKVTNQEIKDFLKGRTEVKLVKRVVVKEDDATVNANPMVKQYQMDTMVYDRYKYRGWEYVLTCIDVYSRYLSMRAMKSRKGEEIMENVKSIMMIRARVLK